MNSAFRLKLGFLLLLALIATAPAAALAQPGCEELNDVATFNYRNFGIGVHRDCGAFDPICEALRLKQIIAGAPLAEWIIASRDAALAAGVSPIPPNVRSRVEHLFPASVLDRARFKTGGGFLGTLQFWREEMGSRGAITLDYVIVLSDQSRLSDIRLWTHELEHVRQYDQLGVAGFAQAYFDQTCVLPGDTPLGGYDSGGCHLERRAERLSNFWNRSDLAAYCTFFWRYVDAAYTGANGAPDGSAARPYPDLTTGVRATVAGSILWVNPGNYSVAGNLLNKRMLIRAPRGGVNIRARSAVAGNTTASLSAASYNGELAGEAIAAAFGEELATQTAVATTLPLPTTLAGVTIKVKDSAGVERDAPLFFVSPGQINYLLPSGTTSGLASISVQRGGSIVASEMLPVAAVAPGLFTANANGQGVPAAVALRVIANGEQRVDPVARFDQQTGRFVSLPIDLGAADEQVFLILFGTGWRGHSGLETIKASIGGEPAEVLFAAGLPNFAGLDQANLRLPRSLIGKGEVSVLFTVGNRSANTVTINVR